MVSVHRIMRQTVQTLFVSFHKFSPVHRCSFARSNCGCWTLCRQQRGNDPCACWSRANSILFHCLSQLHARTRMQDLELDNITRQTELLNSTLCAPKCVPNQYALKDYANRTGPFRVDVVSACAPSTAHCGSCKRIRQDTVLLPGSPYEKTIDQGTCGGKCDGTSKSVYVTCMPNLHSLCVQKQARAANL